MLENFYTKYNWKTMLNRNPKRDYSIEQYFKILSPDYPDFLNKYLNLPLLQRLNGIGLLCGTDWTALYKNRLYYSRLDHSKGVALIIWHFTHDKAQTIAGLLHDVSTPVFSHVSDFRKGDALTQTATEAPNAAMIRNDAQLLKLLTADGLTVEQVEDYHQYPIADNEIPQLSADRLEYMYPSGMALDGSWTMEEIARTYNDISILTIEQGLPELGFNHLEIAEEYCEHFCMIGHILQLNENKLTLHLLGQVMNTAVLEGVLQEDDFMTLSESEIIKKMRQKNLVPVSHKEGQKNLTPVSHSTQKLFDTFEKMTKIEHTDKSLSKDEYFCVNLKVKQRYINPLVKIDNKVFRLYDVSTKAKMLIDDFLSYEDTAYGCVKLV